MRAQEVGLELVGAPLGNVLDGNAGGVGSDDAPLVMQGMFLFRTP